MLFDLRISPLSLSLSGAKILPHQPTNRNPHTLNSKTGFPRLFAIPNQKLPIFEISIKRKSHRRAGCLLLLWETELRPWRKHSIFELLHSCLFDQWQPGKLRSGHCKGGISSNPSIPALWTRDLQMAGGLTVIFCVQKVWCFSNLWIVYYQPIQTDKKLHFTWA